MITGLDNTARPQGFATGDIEMKKAADFDRMAGRFAVRAGAGLALALLVTAATGCGDVLEIDSPSQISATTLNDPAQAELLVNSVVADFECAFTNYTLGAGQNGDELANATGWAAYWDFDRRTSSEAGGVYGSLTCDQTPGGIYVPLSVARFQADNTLTALEGWTDAEVPNRSSLMATAAVYAGYGITLLGEGMCSAAIDLGPELTPVEMFAQAEERFTRAIAAAQTAGNTTMLNAAYVGRARAALGRGDGASAMADALLVPAGFVLNASYSATPPRRYNQVFNWVNRNGAAVVEDDFRNLMIEGVPDTRIGDVDLGIMTVGVVVRPWWSQTKYTSLDSPMPIARYEEAQLIIAEVQGGAAAVAIVDALRAAHGLPAYTGGTSAAEIQDLIITERAAELFLESHHLGDKLRYGLPFTPATGTPFPHIGGLYGSVTCFPLPLAERQNNPSF